MYLLQPKIKNFLDMFGFFKVLFLVYFIDTLINFKKKKPILDFISIIERIILNATKFDCPNL